MAAEQPPRPHTADPESRYSFFGTRRSFPLVGRKKSKAGSILSSSSSLERPSTSHYPVAAPTGLRVRLFLRFSAPLNSEHHAEFQSSPSFEPSDKVCQALLRRLQHCSAELITRRDCTAMDPPHAAPQSRPMRFQMTFCIDRHGLRWAEETFTSYQRDPVTAGLADDILAEARLSVSLFLSRHDPCFPCAEADAAAVRPETRRPSFGLAQSVCCVPHGTDNHLPGYLIELFLRSRGPGTQYNASLRLESQQSTPLTLLLGEDVLSRASRALDAAFGDRKAQFEEQHHACGGLEGTGGCEHITDGAFDALLKIRNNLGPDYNHLSHRLQSCRIVFKQNDSSDFDDFVNLLREQLGAVRDQADHGLNAVDDLSFNVRKLEIHDHSIPSPLCISLDASVTHGRRLTAALLDRVPTGISHKLEGTGASVVLTAHKRGHLVLDTVLGKAQDQAASMSNEPQPRIDDILTSLKYRIRDDIVMLCKDTCALESSDLLQNLRIYDARTAAYNERPSTSGPMLPDEPPVTPTRQSLSKRKGQFNLRQFSLSSSIGDSPCPATSSAQAREYTAVAPSDEAYLSDDSSTPSLVDTDSISPNDSILITPESSRVAHREPPTFGIRLMDDELMGAPISTQELGPHPDEEQTVYERPPFQNPFAPSKAPSALSVSICPDDVDADILPDTKSVPTQATPPCEKHDSPSTEEEEEVQDATATVKENQNSDNSATIIAVTGQVDPPQVESVEDVGTAHIPDVCEADISSSKDWPESAVAESPCTEDIMSSVTEVPSAPVEASLGELKEPQQPEIPISTANELETTQDDGEPIEEEVKIKEGEKPTVEEERTVQGPEKVDEEREKTTMATEDLFVQTETLIEETEKAAEERSMADEKVTGKGEERAGEEEMATQENKQQAGEEETASEKDEEQTGNEETAIEQHENPTELEKAAIENKETVVESTTEYFSLGQSSARPTVQAASDRSKSSALILRQRPGSFHINSFLSEGLSDAASDEKQARRWSNPRPSIRHRRQFSSPTTGYLGLHGEYLVEMGLMNAVIPSHLRSSKP